MHKNKPLIFNQYNQPWMRIFPEDIYEDCSPNLEKLESDN